MSDTPDPITGAAVDDESVLLRCLRLYRESAELQYQNVIGTHVDLLHVQAEDQATVKVLLAELAAAQLRVHVALEGLALDAERLGLVSASNAACLSGIIRVPPPPEPLAAHPFFGKPDATSN